MNTDYPLGIAATDAVCVTIRGGRRDGYTGIHRAGCAHSVRFSASMNPRPLSADYANYEDDFYFVMPCARAKGGNKVV